MADPGLTTIRTALRMSRALARTHAYGGLSHFYNCQSDAIAALDRVEEKVNGNGKQLSFIVPKTGEWDAGSTPLTETDVQAATCSV